MNKHLESILQKPAVDAAPLLLGWILVRPTPQGAIKLRIVETEAYHQGDPASHSFRSMTKHTAPMFEAGGRLYVYFTYGMHHCLNLVVGAKGVGEAVLLRAAEPLEGIVIMQKNRGGIRDINNLANGPGKLTQALGIKDTSLSGKLLNKSSIYLEPPIKSLNAKDIIASPRIGIREAADMPWRFYLKDNSFVTKHRYNKTSDKS